MPTPFAGELHWTNRRPKPEHLAYLGVIGIEVITADGVIKTDPNGLVIASSQSAWKKWRPINGCASVCSGEPAVLYRTHEAEIALTPDELRRLSLRALTPQEFGAICDAVGATWDLHDDFYDPDTGEALQPGVDVPGGPPALSF